MVKVRCKMCNREVEGRTGKTISCGCSNLTTVRNNENVTAKDLSYVVMIDTGVARKNNNILKNEDLMWQEERKKRKIRKIDFEER